MLKSTGGVLCSGFFELENKAIDEIIYLIELTTKIAKESQPKDTNVLPEEIEYK